MKLLILASGKGSRLNKLTKKQVKVIPFWVNKNIWFEIEDKNPLYAKYDLTKVLNTHYLWRNI